MKKSIRLTEGDIRMAILEVLSVNGIPTIKDYFKGGLNESRLLTEGYSGKYFWEQILEIATMFWKKKQYLDGLKDRWDYYYEPSHSMDYRIYISLRPFFKEGEVDDRYLREKEYGIRFYYRRDIEGNYVKGGFMPRLLNSPGSYQIVLDVCRDADFKKVFETLEHEVTHLVDELIKECKGIKTYTFTHNHMDSNNIPKYIKPILYLLWTTTEFNAWQANKGDVSKIFATIMGNLQLANNVNNEEEWSVIRDYVSSVTKKPELSNKSPFDFKNYFIKTSFNRLKKMVKKYY